MYAMQPITFVTGSEIQAPYRTTIQPGNIESGVALGPASRAVGEVLARHVSQPGMVWAKFSSQNTRAVDQYDPMVSGALTTQWALASQPYNSLNSTGNKTNVMAYSGQSGQSGTNGGSDGSVSTTNKTTKFLKWFGINKHETKMNAAEKKAKKAQEKAAKEAKKAEKKKEKADKKKEKSASCKNGSCSSCE